MIYLIYIVIYLIQQVSDLSDLSDEFYSRCRERAFNPFETWAANKNVWKQKDDYSIRHPKQCMQVGNADGGMQRRELVEP